MKNIFKLICGATLAVMLIAPAFARDVSVQGYTKADGTYVAPYTRTAPDSTINNNYSTKPNINPYTGQEGTKAPNPYQSYQPIKPYNPYGKTH